MRPSLVMVAAIVATLALHLLARTARADASSVCPRAAAHAGRIEADHVTWESSYVRSESLDDPPHDQERIELARPLLAELDAARSPGVLAVHDGAGAIVAFAVDTRRASSGRRDVRVVLRAPLVRRGEDVILEPPLARGGAVQRVEVSGDGELRFEPDGSLGLVHEVGSWTTPGISASARRESDALLGGRDAPIDEPPIYVVAASAALDHGLLGRALTSAERARPGMILAVVIFALLAGACAAAYRWLARDARIEQAEATLREEYEREARGE